MSKTNRTEIQSNIDAWEIANKQSALDNQLIRIWSQIPINDYLVAEIFYSLENYIHQQRLNKLVTQLPVSKINLTKQVLQLQKLMVMSPQDFSYRWGLNSEQLANICGISKPTTYHWLCGQKSRREAAKPCQRIMAITDFLLENSEIIYPLIEQWLSLRKYS